MGNRGSRKEINQREQNAKNRLSKFKNSVNSKSFDNFLGYHEASVVDENNVSQERSVTKLEVKIFRSYTNLNDFGSPKYILNDKPINVRIYKKSSQKIDSKTLQYNNEDDEKLLRSISRANSLPRNFGKSRSLRHSAVSISSNENNSRDGRYSRFSLPDRSPNKHKMTKVDFTSGQVLEKRLTLFEKNLVDAILSRFASFSLAFQTSLLPLALFPPTGESSLRAHSLLTLKCYVEDTLDQDFDAIQSSTNGQCALFVQPSILQGLQSLKQNPKDEDVLSFTSLMFASTAREAAADLSRMYEYQIGLLTSDFALDLLANFVADRIISYVTNNMKVPLVDRNSLLLGALKGDVNRKTLSPAVVSVILGTKELKWDVYEIMDKPGLRKSILLDEEGLMLDDGPFQFSSSPMCDHMTYGYRGQLLELDFGRGVYKHHSTECDDFPDEVIWRYDDVHRNYSPHFQLVGEKFLRQFMLEEDNNQIQHANLNTYAKKILDATGYHRDDITTLFRPLSRLNLPDKLISKFDDSELVRRVPGHLLERSTVRASSTLLSTDFPLPESELSSPLRGVLTSTPAAGQNPLNYSPFFSHRSPSSFNDPSFT